MAAYMIAKVNVTDWDKYNEYIKVTPGIIAKYEGRFIVRGGETVTLEGPQEKWRIVVVEFPDLAKAKAFYHSPEYADAKKIRAGAAEAQFIAVSGVE
ncbi:MAG: DUF1330 domain-containing protein [Desulfobacterales bacterium]|jgi:uncharacterized protein (DUF1330 family)|nr:DUF1330 domain-containing protein [Deltaproteobacteria bacterium]